VGKSFKRKLNVNPFSVFSQKALDMNQKKILRIVIMLASIALGTWIIMYYWKVDDADGIIYVPMYLMIVALGYILLQVMKRYLFKAQNWWDWLYYIGLTAILLPIFFGTNENASMYGMITDYGTFFFVIPALIDIRLLADKPKEEEEL
jgi:peptidoglycan/LPS O-acetylase OafA/YrhL